MPGTRLCSHISGRFQCICCKQDESRRTLYGVPCYLSASSNKPRACILRTCMSGIRFWISTSHASSSWMGNLITALKGLCLIRAPSHSVYSELGDPPGLVQLEPSASHPSGSELGTLRSGHGPGKPYARASSVLIGHIYHTQTRLLLMPRCKLYVTSLPHRHLTAWSKNRKHALERERHFVFVASCSGEINRICCTPHENDFKTIDYWMQRVLLSRQAVLG